eukprot:TRINITY_DN4991_c0_g1_i4.p1 TRINITY_DN4991_c0_g1~~TRINITY_DN4991_c0_g1_i4.p1  ORF type:complete len:270 (-),score=26.67 TRINITY_DN4991_c0_g1_i4:84-821(-)
MDIKVAPGAGVVTNFYMSTNNGLYDKSCTHPWVELDFEIMGNQAGPESRIWTNLLRGTCEENNQWITVPFDVSKDYHTYAFDITENSISWLVDGVVYRKVFTRDFHDALTASRASAFRQFISVWGQSASDGHPEGVPAYVAAKGVLNENSNTFPLTSSFRLPEGAAPAAPGPVAPPTAGTTCTGGPALWGDCSARKCCSDGSVCFEKDTTYAQCRQTCAKGIHDDEERQYQTPWSCSPLTPAIRR